MANKIKITVNKQNVSRRVFWQTVKNLCTIKRFYKAYSIRIDSYVVYFDAAEPEEYNILSATLSFVPDLQRRRARYR